LRIDNWQDSTGSKQEEKINALEQKVAQLESMLMKALQMGV